MHFNFRTLKSFNLGIVKQSSDCTMALYDSNMDVTNKLWFCGSTRDVQSRTNCLLKAASSIFAATAEVHAPNVVTDFSRKEVIQHLWVLLPSDGVQEVLERKSHFSLDMVFLFDTAFMNRGTALLERPKIMTVYTLYSNLLQDVYVRLDSCLGQNLSS